MRRLAFGFQGDLLSRVAVVMLAAIAVVSVGSLAVSGLDPLATTGMRLTPPSASCVLGTDGLGRCLLPRVLEGARTTLVISVTAVLLATLLAVPLGMIAGFRKGAVDQLITRTADVLFAFPAMLLAILVSVTFGAGRRAVIIAIVFITLPLMVRVVRASTIEVVQRDFVTTSRVGGASTLRVLAVHLLPSVAGSVVVQASYAASVAILTEGALSFLGFGVQPPAASLGSLVQDGTQYLVVAPWLVLAPGSLMVVAILSLNLLGDGLRDRLDPRGESIAT